MSIKNLRYSAMELYLWLRYVPALTLLPSFGLTTDADVMWFCGEFEERTLVFSVKFVGMLFVFTVRFVVSYVESYKLDKCSLWWFIKLFVFDEIRHCIG